MFSITVQTKERALIIFNPDLFQFAIPFKRLRQFPFLEKRAIESDFSAIRQVRYFKGRKQKLLFTDDNAQNS